MNYRYDYLLYLIFENKSIVCLFVLFVSCEIPFPVFSSAILGNKQTNKQSIYFQ